MTEPVRLDDASVEAVARRVAELVRDREPTPDWIDAAEVARRLGVKTDYVYRHAAELGAEPLGKGPKPRLRFDAEAVEEHLRTSRRREASPPPKVSRKAAPPRPARVELLEIKGDG